MKKGTVLLCSWCGEEFKYKKDRPDNANGVYFCGHTCQVYWSHTKQKTDAQRLFTCTQCGIEFPGRLASRRKSKGNSFCSLLCRNEFAKSRHPEMVTLVCSVCGNSFTRLARLERTARKAFNLPCCSRKCSSVIAHKNDIRMRVTTFLSGVLHKQYKTGGIYPVTISEDDLINQWERQDGRCPYTGVELELRPIRNRKEKHPYQASLDRIVPELGYVPGNIEFVSLIANYTKHVWDKSVVLDFALRVVENAKRNSSS